MKLSVKINLLFTIMVTSILLVMAGIIYNVTRQGIKHDFRLRLKTRATRTAYLFNTVSADSTNLLKSLDSTTTGALLNKNVNVYDEQHHLLYEYHDATSKRLDPPPERFAALAKDSVTFFRIERKEVGLFRYKGSRGRFVVMVAAENINGEEYLSNVKRLFLIYLPLALIFTIIAGYLFSRSLLRPVKNTIDDVRLITSQNLSHRLFVGQSKDELSMLNATFNDLLNRLEESFSMQRRFISNASHELSTPLTSLSSQLEVALLQDRSGDEYRKIIVSALEDVREMQQLTKTLLEIARAGTHGTISLESVRIDEVVLKAHSDTIRQNPGFIVELEFEDFPEDENECMVFGNSILLQSAFRNIMENGCKYSPDHTVDVRLHFAGSQALLTFTNRGDSIEGDEISRLFEPFYRSANAEGKPGVGLGLTLTRRIISLHKGELTAVSDAGTGTIFTITLPTMKA